MALVLHSSEGGVIAEGTFPTNEILLTEALAPTQQKNGIATSFAELHCTVNQGPSKIICAQLLSTT